MNVSIMVECPKCGLRTVGPAVSDLAEAVEVVASLLSLPPECHHCRPVAWAPEACVMLDEATADDGHSSRRLRGELFLDGRERAVS